MDYNRRIKKVIEYIGKHLDDELSLEMLSEISCFSKFHFHRIFTAMTGLSLHQLIRWLRLRRAAQQLLIEKDNSIIDIAMQAGFESHEAFTRAFKKMSGCTPKVFREQGKSHFFYEPLPYALPNKGEIEMNVDIREMKAMRLALIDHIGDPANMPQSVNKLIGWAKAQSIDLKPKPGCAFGFAYDDPKTTQKEKFRFGLGLKVPEGCSLDNTVTEKYLPEGRYAVATHYGSHDNIGETVYGLYRDWLPNSGESLGELPCIFSYQNFEHEVAQTELVTECWLLLK